MTSDCCRLLCIILSPAQTVPSTSSGKSPQTSVVEKTRMEMQDWLQMPVIQNSDIIGKNEDGSDITQDVDVLVWWRDVGQARFPHIDLQELRTLLLTQQSLEDQTVWVLPSWLPGNGRLTGSSGR
jgi:hypothetical protein